MNFLRRVQDSIYAPAFYGSLEDRPLSFSFKYYYFLAANLALLLAIVLAITFVPALWGFVQTLPSVVNEYPADLVITIKDGRASANISQPYAIPIPPDLSKDASDPANVLVIATEAPFAPESFDSYDTIFLLTEQYLVYDKGEALEARRLSDVVSSKTIDRGLLQGYADKIGSLARWGIPIVAVLLAVFIFLGFVLIYSAMLLYAIAAGVFVWLVAKIRGLGWGYKKSYQAALHALTLSMIYFACTIVGFPHIPALFHVLFAGVVLLNLYRVAQPAVRAEASSDHAA